MASRSNLANSCPCHRDELMLRMWPFQVIVRRGDTVDGLGGPIIVCTRNDDLQGVHDATPSDRREGDFAAASHRYAASQSLLHFSEEEIRMLGSRRTKEGGGPDCRCEMW